VTARMAAIGAVVQARQPHFVCLQEVTPLIYRLLAESPWWRCYHASPCPPDVPYFTALLSHSSVQPRGACRELPFENSAMGERPQGMGDMFGSVVCGTCTALLDCSILLHMQLLAAVEAILLRSLPVFQHVRPALPCCLQAAT
jgi:hypothetical protein